jgi:hypothetical protein
MNTELKQLLASGLVRNPADVERQVRLLTAGHTGMRADDLRTLVASISPTMVDELVSTQMHVTLLEEFFKWPENWTKWCERESTHFLTTQYVERVNQLGAINPLEETGDRYSEVAAPTATELSYLVKGFGNLMSLDLRTVRSDRFKYFTKISEAFGRAAAKRLHTFIYKTTIQDNPTLAEDSNSLFDNTNHSNDCDSGSAGKPATYENLRTARRKIATALDGASEPLFNDGFYIVCGTHWEDDFLQLAENPKRPGTANDELNQMKRYIRGVDVSRMLGYDWYLVAADLHGFLINFLDGREKPLFEPESDTSTFKYETDKTRFKISHWYGGIWQRPIAIVRGSANVLAS